MFSRILVPLDRTPQSNVALPPARALARATGASIVLLQVVDLPWPELPADQPRAIQAKENLARSATELAHGDVVVDCLVH